MALAGKLPSSAQTAALVTPCSTCAIHTTTNRFRKKAFGKAAATTRTEDQSQCRHLRSLMRRKEDKMNNQDLLQKIANILSQDYPPSQQMKWICELLKESGIAPEETERPTLRNWPKGTQFLRQSA
ncbi:MAG TPA: hypothetical protein PLJ74_12635 [Myxococcota bacterium]|nr:hypothetical protein [Myxococcota bacterium]